MQMLDDYRLLQTLFPLQANQSASTVRTAWDNVLKSQMHHSKMATFNDIHYFDTALVFLLFWVVCNSDGSLLQYNTDRFHILHGYYSYRPEIKGSTTSDVLRCGAVRRHKATHPVWRSLNPDAKSPAAAAAACIAASLIDTQQFPDQTSLIFSRD